MKKKIFWHIQQLNRLGGTEMVSIDLCNQLVEDYDVYLITSTKPEGESPFKIDPRIKIISLDMPVRFANSQLLMQKYLDHFRIFSLAGLGIQIFYHYIIKRGSYRRKISKLLDEDSYLVASSIDSYLLAPKKHKVFFHFHFQDNIFFRIDNKSVLGMSRKPDKYIFLTKSTRDAVCKVKPKLEDKSIFIYNPSRIEPELDLSYHDNTMIFIGRFDEQKNPLLALKVAKTLKDRGQHFKLKMFGDQVLINKMNEYIKENNIEDVVELYPPTKDIKKELLNSDLVLMTSAYEGLPLVLIEGNSLSRPFVSTYWNKVIDEVFVDGKNGIVIRSNNEEEFADKIIELFNDKEKLKALKQSAYDESKKMSHEYIIPQWKELFK